MTVTMAEIEFYRNRLDLYIYFFPYLSVLPLLLLFCLCGGAAAMGNFKAIPFDAKEQLIAYHTEGQGEDKVRFTKLICSAVSSIDNV